MGWAKDEDSKMGVAGKGGDAGLKPLRYTVGGGCAINVGP